MGYGATPNGKRQLFPASRLHVRPTKHDGQIEYGVVTVDLAALFRKLVPFDLGADVSPYKAVSTIFLPAVHRIKAKTIVFCFDSPHLVPEMRKIFHAERRYAKAEKEPGPHEIRCPEDGRNYHVDKYPASAADIEGLTMHSMPKWWPCFWNSAKGKYALWQMVEESIKEYLRSGWGRRGVQYIIDAQDGRRWAYPAVDITMPALNYGEGDMKSILWATHYARESPVLVMTIDWDVILAVSLYAANIHVWIGTVFADREDAATLDQYDETKVKLTRKGGQQRWGADRATAMLEILEMPRIQLRTRTMRMHAVMVALACGGVDYCYGLSKFGFSEKRILPLAHELRESGYPNPWLQSAYDDSDPYRRYLRFYPGNFIRALSSAWEPRKCKGTLKELEAELLNMLYCVTYFIGFDSQRAPAGPLPPQHRPLFPKGTHVHDVVHNPDGVEVLVEEYYPADERTLPHPPSHSYDGEQLEHLI